MLTTFAVYVDDAPGVLNRVASLFRRRAFNIASLTVGHTERAGESRMTVVVDTDIPPERVEANLYKLIDVRLVEIDLHVASVDYFVRPRPRIERDADQTVSGKQPRPFRGRTLFDVFGDDSLRGVDPLDAVPGGGFVV